MAVENDPVAREAALKGRRVVAWLSTAYLVILLAGFGVYTFWAAFRDAVPDTIGVLPIGVPFFGALGATLISLVGVTDHRTDWDLGYKYWHYTRPLVGAVVGTVGCLIFLVIVRAAAEKSASTTPDDLTFCVIAFVLGYREETFRALVKRLVDTILEPAKKEPDPPANPPGPVQPPAPGQPPAGPTA